MDMIQQAGLQGITEWLYNTFDTVKGKADTYIQQLKQSATYLRDSKVALDKYKGRIPDTEYLKLLNQWKALKADHVGLVAKLNKELNMNIRTNPGLGVAPIVWAGVGLVGVGILASTAYFITKHLKESYEYKKYIDAYTLAVETNTNPPSKPIGIGTMTIPWYVYAGGGLALFIIGKQNKWW